MKVVAITCTGDRPEAYKLCRRWIRDQTRQPDMWVVIDDGCSIVHAIASPREVVTLLPPMEGHSLSRNLLAAIGLTEGLMGSEEYAVVMIEDDDYYAPNHIETVVGWLEDGHDIVGAGSGDYYHLAVAGWRTLDISVKYASLCRTAFRSKVIPYFRKSCLERPEGRGIDMVFWDKCWSDRQINQKVFKVHRHTCVSIKGMPGRQGIGALWKTHGVDGTAKYETDAKHYSKLRELVGQDAQAYIELIESGRCQVKEVSDA